MVTLNLQKGVPPDMQIPDAWHHQMVYGVGPKGKAFVWCDRKSFQDCRKANRRVGLEVVSHGCRNALTDNSGFHFASRYVSHPFKTRDQFWYGSGSVQTPTYDNGKHPSTDKLQTPIPQTHTIS